MNLSANASGHTVEYIVSARGKLQLVVDGYAYYRNKLEGDRQSFYCIQYKTLRFVADSTIHRHLIGVDLKHLQCFVIFMINVFPFRCPAKARTYTKSDQVDIIDARHNHPLYVPRRKHGEGLKLKQAILEKNKNVRK